MNCEQARDRMIERVYGELDAGQIESLEGHLRGCPACGEEWSRLQAARAALSAAWGAAGRPSVLMAKVPAAGEAQRRRRPWLLWLGSAAAAAAVAIAVLRFDPGVDPTPPDPPGGGGGGGGVPPTVHPQATVALSPGWRVTPTGGADFRVLTPTRIRLDRGELRIGSVPIDQAAGSRAELVVETSAGTATAAGTDFFIGTHEIGNPVPGLKGTAMRARLVRVFVLAGTVVLANSLGRIEGGPGRLLAAEAGKPPENLALKANADFAVDLYKQLAKENPGRNILFSPYSVSTALAMAAEGARGATADEMGRVLRFPAAARRMGDDAQLLPWNTSLIHTGMGALQDRFNGKDRAVPPALRERIAALKKDLATANQRLGGPLSAQDYEAAEKKAHDLAAELNGLLSQVDQYELRVANGLWGEKTSPFQKSFLDVLNAHYATGGIRNLDFRGDPQGCRKIINDWCEEQTKGRIKEPVPAGGITSDTRMVLANAIYFLGEWAEPFDAKRTEEADFAAPSGKVKARLMDHAGMKQARYAAFNADGSLFATPDSVPFDRRPDPEKVYPGAGGFLAAELPYKGGDISMVLLVPQSADGLAALEAKLGSEQLGKWLGCLTQRTTQLQMPKFKVETSYEEMAKSLASLGMTLAFTTAADFSGITTSEPLFISQVIHKAFVEVNEKGTEAAAVTVIAFRGGGFPRTMPFVPAVRADKPFLYLIRDVKTGTILFMGRVTDPGRGA